MTLQNIDDDRIEIRAGDRPEEGRLSEILPSASRTMLLSAIIMEPIALLMLATTEG